MVWRNRSNGLAELVKWFGRGHQKLRRNHRNKIIYSGHSTILVRSTERAPHADYATDDQASKHARPACRLRRCGQLKCRVHAQRGRERAGGTSRQQAHAPAPYLGKRVCGRVEYCPGC
jgi:hypothetical protein